MDRAQAPPVDVDETHPLLEQCLEIALQENRKRPASLAAVTFAEAQHRQALSAYWPQLTLTASATLRSDNPDHSLRIRAQPPELVLERGMKAKRGLRWRSLTASAALPLVIHP